MLLPRRWVLAASAMSATPLAIGASAATTGLASTCDTIMASALARAVAMFAARRGILVHIRPARFALAPSLEEYAALQRVFYWGAPAAFAMDTPLSEFLIGSIPV